MWIQVSRCEPAQLLLLSVMWGGDTGVMLFAAVPKQNPNCVCKNLFVTTLYG